MYFQIRDLNVYYRAIHALQGISLTVNRGEIVALIGGNGAGKSSTLNSISGVVEITSGSITYQDEKRHQYPHRSDRSKGPRSGPGRTAYFPENDRAGKSGDGRVPQERPGADSPRP